MKFVNFSLPGIWEDAGSGLYVKYYNDRKVFIEASPDGQTISFRAKVSGVFGGMMLATQQVDEAQASQASWNEITLTVFKMEQSINYFLKTQCDSELQKTEIVHAGSESAHHLKNMGWLFLIDGHGDSRLTGGQWLYKGNKDEALEMQKERWAKIIKPASDSYYAQPYV